jgi:hypothetical protein
MKLPSSFWDAIPITPIATLWVIQHYEEIEHSENDEKWKVFVRRAEALYALACYVANREQSDGLAGRAAVRRGQQRVQGCSNSERERPDTPRGNPVAPRDRGADDATLAATALKHVLPETRPDWVMVGLPQTNTAQGIHVLRRKMRAVKDS